MVKRILLLLLIFFIPVVQAQMPIPPVTGTMTVENETASLTIGVPEGWESSVIHEEGVDPYGVMSNLSGLQPDEVPMLVQVALRPLENLEVNVNTDTVNPAMEYSQSYADARGLEQEGAYADPVEVRDGAFRGALMLYVEENSDPRFEAYEHILSLSLVSYAGDEQMLILLFEGPAENWIDLLAMWNVLLTTLEFNGRPLEFEDVAQTLISFESPDSLVERYVNGDTLPENAVIIEPDTAGEPMQLRLVRNTITAFAPPEWTLLEDDDPLAVTAQSPDENAILTMRVSLLPDDYVSLLALMETQDNVEKTVLFTWDDVPAVAASLQSGGRLVVAELPFDGGLLWLAYEADDTDEHQQAWMNFLTGVQMNGQTLIFDNVWGAMFQLEE